MGVLSFNDEKNSSHLRDDVYLSWKGEKIWGGSKAPESKYRATANAAKKALLKTDRA